MTRNSDEKLPTKLLMAWWNNKHQVGGVLHSNKKTLVQNIALIVPTVDKYGSLKLWSHLALDNKYWNNHQKYKISYVPLYPVADYIYIADLNTRLSVGWKTLPNLNFKLKFQTQISNWNLNFKTKIFPILPVNPGFWEIDYKGKRNERNKVISCYLGKVMSWSRGGTEGF